MNKKINMIKLLSLIIVSLTAFTFVFGQAPGETDPPGAREAMRKFVELNNKQSLQTDEARALFSGSALEWKDAWFGQAFSQPDKIVPNEKNHAVARIQAVEKNSRVVDLYFYLKYEDGWKIRSMRAMAQTGWLESIVENLKSKPAAALTTEEKESLANAELTLYSDKQLTEWFQKNRRTLDGLIAAAPPIPKKKPVRPPKPRRVTRNGITTIEVSAVAMADPDMEISEPQTIERITGNTVKFPKAAAALRNLHLTALETKADDNIEIIIGGMTDNTVGFIYSPKEKPPQIDGWRYIWMEKMAAAPGWYLFRTT